MQTIDGSRRREHYFYGFMAGAVLLTVFAGFAPTYYLAAWFDAPPLAPLVHLHGIVFTAWVMLFAVQVRLVMTRRTALHRRVGGFGAGLALSMVLLGVITAVVSAQHGHTPSAAIPPLSFLAIPLFNIAAFGLLVGVAIWRRRDPATHKRLMLSATLCVLAPAFARLPLGFIQTGGPPAFFGLTDLLWLACLAYDGLTRRRVHAAWLAGGGVILASQVGSLLAATSAPWLAFARWLAG